MISELNIPGSLVQISYDTCNMYPSIPIDETLEITLRELEKDESLKERTNWKPIWTQTDAAPIGKSFSGCICGIFMADFEKKNILHNPNLPFKPLFWKRFVDDVYCIWQHGIRRAEAFLKFINAAHPRIKWTSEMEENDALPFTDLNIKELVINL